ncbi:MAG: Lrp/AsnC family transcriptional regulator [Candidatus Diapherotrites archaeon]|nr:Lrp/AsnC family transcriptional regulator [Candidatus Diapherotrites archaeon]
MSNFNGVVVASSPKLDDEIRLKILEACLKQGSVSPNIRAIQRTTGFHKATIKTSLDFLKKKGLLQGFGPKITIKTFGYPLEVFLILQVDTSQTKTFEKFLEVAQKDSHLYRISPILGSGNWNLLIRFIYKDVESFHKDLQKRYYDTIPGFYDLVKSREIFYATEPHYKNSSRTNSILGIIKEEKGLE